jgi:hypothetical protein
MKRFPAFLSSLVFSGLVATAVTACGGTQDGPPSALSTHFQDSYIAQLGPDKQASVLEAQTGYAASKMEKAKADADLSETQLQLDLANNDAKKSATSLDSAKKAKAAADKTADQTRITQATKELATAETAAQAAIARRQYMTDFRNWLKAIQRYTDHNQYWRESQVELNKAKVAQSNNIAPKGFALAQYEGQETKRAKATGAAKDKAAALKTKAAASREAWLKVQGEADKATGSPNTFPDPMPKVEAGSDMTKGTTGVNASGAQTTTGGQSVQDPTTNSGVNPTPAPK